MKRRLSGWAIIGNPRDKGGFKAWLCKRKPLKACIYKGEKIVKATLIIE